LEQFHVRRFYCALCDIARPCGCRRVASGMAKEWRLLEPRIMKSFRTVCFASLIVLALAGCKDVPGADGRYAHGYGYPYRAGDGPWAP
jgi:hypothetical protein